MHLFNSISKSFRAHTSKGVFLSNLAHTTCLSLSFHKSSNFLKMSQQFDIAKTYEPKHVTNSYGVKKLGVNMGENGSSKKPRVSQSRKRADKQDSIQDAEPLQMIVPVDISKKNPKCSGLKKNFSTKKGKTLCSRYLCA